MKSEGVEKWPCTMVTVFVGVSLMVLAPPSQGDLVAVGYSVVTGTLIFEYQPPHQ